MRGKKTPQSHEARGCRPCAQAFSLSILRKEAPTLGIVGALRGRSRSEIRFNVIETEKQATATVAEMAVLNFAGAPDLKGVSDKEIAAISKRCTDEIYTLSYLALAQMRMDKDALVSAIRNSDGEIWASMLEALSNGQEKARLLLGFLQTAEARLLVAPWLQSRRKGPTTIRTQARRFQRRSPHNEALASRPPMAG
jgi:hypothetical protein